MALANTFIQNFDSNSLDTVNTFNVVGANVQNVNKRIEIPLAASTSGSHSLSTKVNFDLTNNSSFIKMTGYRDGATSAEAEFLLLTSAASTTGLNWIIGNGSISANHFTAGTRTGIFSATYHPGRDAWFRMRHSGTSLFWDTAPITASNPPIEADWTQRASVDKPAGIDVTVLFQRIRGGAFDALSTNPGTATFDGWNTVQESTVNYQEINYVGITATSPVGTTSIAVPYPPSIVVGDRMILSVTSKYAQVPATPAGWTLIASHIGGIAAAGVDSGSPCQSLFFKDVVSGETSATTVTVTKTTETGTAMIGSIVALRRQPGSDWAAFATSKGADTTGGDNWSVTGDVALNAREGDLFLACSSLNSDISTPDAHEITMSGVQFGSIVEEKDFSTTNGDDARQSISLHYCTSGTATVAPVYTFTSTNNTLTTAPAGPTIILRARAVVTVALAGNALTTKLATGNISVRPRLLGNALTTKVATGALTVRPALAGASLTTKTATGALVAGVNLSGDAFAKTQTTGAITVRPALAGSAFAKTTSTGWLSKIEAHLAGNAFSTKTATGNLRVGVELEGSATSTKATTGNLTVPVRLSGDTQTSADATGELTVPVELTGDASCKSFASGDIEVGVPLSGETAAATVSTAALVVVEVYLSGDAFCSVKAEGFLRVRGQGISADAYVRTDAMGWLSPVGVNLSGDAVMRPSGMADLVSGIGLSGDALCFTEASGLLEFPIDLAGDALVKATGGNPVLLTTTFEDLSGEAQQLTSGSADIVVGVNLAGNALCKASGTADLKRGSILFGDAFAQTSATGELSPVEVLLSGAANQATNANAITLRVGVPLAGNARCSASGSARFTVALRGAALCSVRATGRMRTGVRLSGAALSAKATAGRIRAGVRLAGASRSAASGTGKLTVDAHYAGNARCKSFASGRLFTRTPIALAGSATATVRGGIATLSTRLVLSGSAFSTKAVTGLLTVGIPLAGAVQLKVRATGDLEQGQFLPGDDGSFVNPGTVDFWIDSDAAPDNYFIDPAASDYIIQPTNTGRTWQPN